jgi:hypothetical protein
VDGNDLIYSVSYDDPQAQASAPAPAPPKPIAAKEKAKEIVTLLTQNEKQGDIIPENSVDNGGVNSEPLPPTGTSKPKTSPPKIDMLTEKEMKERAITHFGPGSKLDGRPWTTNE